MSTAAVSGNQRTCCAAYSCNELLNKRWVLITLLALFAIGLIVGSTFLHLAPNSAYNVINSWRPIGVVCGFIAGGLMLLLAGGLAVSLCKKRSAPQNVERREEELPPQTEKITRQLLIDLTRTSDTAGLNQLPWDTVRSVEQIVEEVSKDPKKFKTYLTTDTTEAYQKTREILQMFDPAVIPSLAPEMSGLHFRMLSNQQYRSPTFPAEELIKEATKRKTFFSTDPEEIDRTKAILKMLDPKIFNLLKPHIPSELSC
jgi:hypothetical protein